MTYRATDTIVLVEDKPYGHKLILEYKEGQYPRLMLTRCDLTEIKYGHLVYKIAGKNWLVELKDGSAVQLHEDQFKLQQNY